MTSLAFLVVTEYEIEMPAISWGGCEAHEDLQGSCTPKPGGAPPCFLPRLTKDVWSLIVSECDSMYVGLARDGLVSIQRHA